MSGSESLPNLGTQNFINQMENPTRPGLTRFAQEAELQRLLTDEKLRSEQHKYHFQTLKTEHIRLQDDYKKIQIQMKQMNDENQRIKESYKALIQQYKKELLQKQSELEQTRKDVLTPQHANLLRMNMQEEIEKKYKGRFTELEEESEQYRSICNKLRYEVTFLKAEFQHSEQKHQRMQEETKLKLEAELNRVTQECNNLQSALQAQKLSQDASLIKKLQQDNIELQHRLKLLQSDMEELQAQKEHSSSQAESLQHLQIKQLAEHTAAIRGLELEKSSIQMHSEHLQKELQEALNSQNEQNSELRQAQQKVKEFHFKMQDVEHKSRIEIANMRMEMMKQKGEVERERDQLAAEILNIKTELELAKQALQQQSKLTEDREKESQRHIQSIQEEEWKKMQKIENENLELESRIEELEHLQLESGTQHRKTLAKAEEKISLFLQEKQFLQSELEKLRTKQENLTPQFEEFHKNRQEIGNLYQEIQTAQEEKQKLRNLNNTLKNEQQQCTETLDKIKTDLTKAQSEIDKQKALHETALIQQQFCWEESKRQFQNRIMSLENQLRETHGKYNGESQSARWKLKKYRKISGKLRDRTRLLKAKVEELETEKEILKKNVPHQVHRMLQKQLKELQRKLSQFHNFMLTTDASATSLVVPASDSSQFVQTLRKPPRTNQLTIDTDQEIQLVKNRMQVLDRKQKLQLIELDKESDQNADDEDSSDNHSKKESKQ